MPAVSFLLIRYSETQTLQPVRNLIPEKQLWPCAQPDSCCLVKVWFSGLSIYRRNPSHFFRFQHDRSVSHFISSLRPLWLLTFAAYTQKTGWPCVLCNAPELKWLTSNSDSVPEETNPFFFGKEQAWLIRITRGISVFNAPDKVVLSAVSNLRSQNRGICLRHYIWYMLWIFRQYLWCLWFIFTRYTQGCINIRERGQKAKSQHEGMVPPLHMILIRNI